MAEISLREAEIRACLSPLDFIASCDQAFRLYGQGILVNPPRQETLTGEHFRLEMPAEWPGRYRSRKIIEERSATGAGRLGERQAFTLLEDLARGTRVRLEADWATDMRTGAAGALGIQYLASGPVARIGILGTGRVARSLALCADRLFALEEIRVFSRQPANREAFARQLGPLLRAPLRLAESVAGCIASAEAILAAVPAPQPILSLAELSSSVLLSAMGGDSRTRQLAPEILEQVPLIVDHLDQAKNSGEFKFAQEQGRFERIEFARGETGQVLHIGDAACGRLPAGPGRPRQAYFTGLAVQDLCVAVALYERLLKEKE